MTRAPARRVEWVSWTALGLQAQPTSTRVSFQHEAGRMDSGT